MMDLNNQISNREIAFTNSLIVSVLLKFYSDDIKALKTFRLVNPTWDKCAKALIKKRNDVLSIEPKLFESNYDISRFICTFQDQLLLHNSFSFNVSQFRLSHHNELFVKFCYCFGKCVKGLDLSKYAIMKKSTWNIQFPKRNNQSNDLLSVSTDGQTEVLRIGPKNFRKLLFDYFPKLEYLAIRETLYSDKEFHPIFFKNHKLFHLSKLKLLTTSFESSNKKISREILKISQNLKNYIITFEGYGTPGGNPNQVSFIDLSYLNNYTTKAEFHLEINTKEMEKIEHKESYFSPINQCKSFILYKFILSNWKKENTNYLSTFFTNAKFLADSLYALQIYYSAPTSQMQTTGVVPNCFPNVKFLDLCFSQFDEYSYPEILEEIMTKFYHVEELYIKKIKIGDSFKVGNVWLNLTKLCLVNVELTFTKFPSLIGFLQSIKSNMNLSHFLLHLSANSMIVPDFSIIADIYFLWADKQFNPSKKYIFQVERNGIDQSHYVLNKKDIVITPMESNHWATKQNFIYTTIKILNLLKYPIFVMNELTLKMIKIEFPLLESLSIRFTSYDLKSMAETLNRFRKTRACLKNVLFLYTQLAHLNIEFDTPIEEFENVLEGDCDYCNTKNSKASIDPANAHASLRNFKNLETLTFRWNFDPAFEIKYPHMFEKSEAADGFFLHDTIVNRVFNRMSKFKKLQMSMIICSKRYKENLINNFLSYDNIFSKISPEFLTEFTQEECTKAYVLGGMFRYMRDLSITLSIKS